MRLAESRHTGTSATPTTTKVALLGVSILMLVAALLLDTPTAGATHGRCTRDWDPQARVYVFTGTDHDETCYGTSGRDVFNMRAGNDTAHGLGGNDSIYLGTGNDYGYGGPGSDSISGAGGADVLYGQADGDSLYGGANNLDGTDFSYGGDGNDYLDDTEGSNDWDVLEGQEGNDLMTVVDIDYLDSARGGGGNDGGPGGTHTCPKYDVAWGHPRYDRINLGTGEGPGENAACDNVG